MCRCVLQASHLLKVFCRLGGRGRNVYARAQWLAVRQTHFHGPSEL